MLKNLIEWIYQTGWAVKQKVGGRGRISNNTVTGIPQYLSVITLSVNSLTSLIKRQICRADQEIKLFSMHIQKTYLIHKAIHGLKTKWESKSKQDSYSIFQSWLQAKTDQRRHYVFVFFKQCFINCHTAIIHLKHTIR